MGVFFFFFKLKHETLKKCTARGRLLWLRPRPQGARTHSLLLVEKLQCVHVRSILSVWQRQALAPEKTLFCCFLADSE